MIVVTGANGFVGRALLSRLAAEHPGEVRGTVRSDGVTLPSGVERVNVGDLGPDTDWTATLRNADVVVHAAARVHVMREHGSDALASYQRANTSATLALARQAAAAKVRRLVFLSSIKVNGDRTMMGRPFTPSDAPAPTDAYAISKLEAEEGLRTVARATGLEVVIIRPVLVYGPGVKANFEAMLRWLDRGLPLPLGGIRNARSLVSIDNLVDLVVCCLEHPAAAQRTFLVSDGEDLSTPELMRRAAHALGRRARLLPVPAATLEWGAKLIGRAAAARRLCSSLQVDIAATREVLGWSPPQSVDEALAVTARHFLGAEPT